ncbi:MAG: HEAT repeat domain-containing protein [Acidobacteriales bacterium]|nr:HEAT repeat domain-containing protein [Terriglobales bacterium]
MFAAAQTSGQFYMEKESYALGEPIFVQLKVVNHGPKAEAFYADDRSSLQPICSPYRIRVSRVWPVEVHHLSCPPRGISIGCGPRKIELQPGETYVDRVLLNIHHKVDAAGTYTVEALYGRVSEVQPENTTEIQSTLHFVVDEKPAGERVFEPWVAQLHSTDPMERLEAARILASVAPRSLEDTLLTFANDRWIRQYAPLAFHRLNTPRSTAAMNELLANSEPGTWERRKASEYLANDQCAGDY